MTRWFRALARCIFAALWALPGPILVGVCLAIVIGPWGYYDWSGLVPPIETAIKNVSVSSAWFCLQVPLAIVYGAVRAMFGPLHWQRGGVFGGLVWAGVGTAVFVIGLAARNRFYFGDITSPGDRPTPIESQALHIYVRYLGHVVAGAVAGFHVEHYLLREAKRSAH